MIDTPLMRTAAIMALQDEIKRQESFALRPLYPCTAEMHQAKADAAKKELAMLRQQERP